MGKKGKNQKDIHDIEYQVKGLEDPQESLPKEDLKRLIDIYDLAENAKDIKNTLDDVNKDRTIDALDLATPVKATQPVKKGGHAR